MSDLPNPFGEISSAGIDAAGPIAFMVDYGWNDEDTLEYELKTNEKHMLQEMWDVSHAQGRMQGQIEAAATATKRVEEKQARIEELESEVARVQEEAKTKAQLEIEGEWAPKVRSLQEQLQEERDRHQNTLTALQKTVDRVEELKDQLKAERAERRIGFRVWWNINSVAAAAFRASSRKVASYTES